MVFAVLISVTVGSFASVGKATLSISAFTSLIKSFVMVSFFRVTTMLENPTEELDSILSIH
jgi:hypothetical protein